MSVDRTSNPLAGMDAADWKNVLDLIGDQKAEIERLTKELGFVRETAAIGCRTIEWLSSELASESRSAQTLRAALARWEKNCTGKHGSQVACGSPDETKCGLKGCTMEGPHGHPPWFYAAQKEQE